MQTIAGKYDLNPRTIPDGEPAPVQINNKGQLVVAGPSGGGGDPVQVQILDENGDPLDYTTPSPVASLTQLIQGTLTRSTKTSAYASSGLIMAQSATAGSCSGVALAVGRVNDGTGMIRRIRLKTTDTSFLNAQIRVHLYKDTPTFANGDNGNWAAGTTESSYIGYADVVLDRSFSDGVKGIGVPAQGSEFNFQCSSGTQNIFFVLETRAATGGSHTSQNTFIVTAETLQN